MNKKRFKDFYTENEIYNYNIDIIFSKNYSFNYRNFIEYHDFLEFQIDLESDVERKKDSSDEVIRRNLKFVEDNILLFKSIYFANKLDIGREIDNDTFTKINKFVETGIIIKEDL